MATTTIRTGSGTRVAPASLEALNSTTSIPVIDLTNIFSTDKAIRASLAEEIRKACTQVGFFYVQNHGIPEDLVSRQFDAAKTFFKQPAELKSSVKMADDGASKTGYVPLMAEQVDPDSRGDLHEAYDYGTRGFGGFEEEDMKLNQWPDETGRDIIGFKKQCVEYWEAVHKLCMSLLPLMALALGIDEEFFDAKLRHPSRLCRLLYYPPQTDETLDPSCLGIGAHTDYELITVLAQGDVPALQILDAQNQWIHAPVIPGTFVCNIGDEMQRWTNNVFKSTVHRAINRSGVARYSVPYFFGADYDTMIKPISACVTTANPSRYSPVVAGEYLTQRLSETYH